jgi:NAD(P)-dependent dehydrogenase (short-subunit alcohol dehydrogenase family)
VVVTGGAGGIGRAMAHRFGTEGARVAIVDLPSSPLDAAAGQLRLAGIGAVALPCDITDPVQVADTMAAVRDRFGPIDVLINNAGVTHRSAFSETQPAVIRRVMEVNFFGALNCTQACQDDLIGRGGLIVVISSIAGVAPLYGRTGYSASKHALHGLFESIGAELAADGVDVLMVCPSFVESGLEASTLGADGERIDRPRSKVGHLRQPEQVADAVVKAARRGRRRLVLTPVGKTSAVLAFVAPKLYERLMIRGLRSELDQNSTQ